MHTLTFLTLFLPFTLPTLAQNFSETYVIEQSPPFNLVLSTHNKTLNGSYLGACHDGAAFEGLCVVPYGNFNSSNNYISFQFNTTRYICTETNSTGIFTVPCSPTPIDTDPTLQSGILTWSLYFGGGPAAEHVSQSMQLIFFPWSNVAMTQISFNEGTDIAWDREGRMNILQNIDDTLEPRSEYLKKPKKLYRWWICWTNWSGYHYTTLTWVLGEGKPQNPTCEKVDVKRVWV